MSQHSHEPYIKKVTAEVLGVKPEEVSIDFRLMGGMSNFTYVINVNENRYTFRIPGKKAEKFVDREVEKYHIDLIEGTGLNNETVYLDTESGVKIARYIEGTPLHETKTLDYLEEAANVLRTLHDSNLQSKYNYAPFKRIEQYESYLEEFDYTHEKRYFDYKKDLFAHGEFLARFEQTFTHGDAQISNFVVTDNGLRLMDWEFSGQNDPFFDLAQFGNKDFDHAIALLPIYLKRTPTHDDFKRLYLWRIDLCLQWHNVALYKHMIGLSEDLGIPFDKVASMYLDKAAALLSKL